MQFNKDILNDIAKFKHTFKGVNFLLSSHSCQLAHKSFHCKK